MDNERIQRLHKFMHDFKMFLRDNYYDIENKDIQWYLRGLVQFNVNESSELIMENYEKLYKEALERAKEINNEQQAQPFDVMTRVFPELKGSEDDKIRKVLIDYFKGYKEHEECGIRTFYGIPTNDFLAWLEKQGESKFEQCIQEDDKIVTNEDGTHFNVSQLERVAKNKMQTIM